MSESAPARCVTHGTVLTSAGTCVLCERRSGRSTEAPASRSSSVPDAPTSIRALPLIVIGLVVVLVGGAAVHRVVMVGSDLARPVPKSESARSRHPASASNAGSPSPASGAPVSADREQRIVAAQREVRIDLYGEGWCPSCRAAKKYLDDNDIPYTYRDTSVPENSKAMRALNPRRTIPVIDIEGSVLVGFSARRMQAEIRRAAEVRVANAER